MRLIPAPPLWWSESKRHLIRECSSVRLNLGRKYGRRSAFLPDLPRVCGFVCNLKQLEWNPRGRSVAYQPGALVSALK